MAPTSRLSLTYIWLQVLTIDALGGGSGELGSGGQRISGAPFGFYVQLAMASRLFNIEQGKSIEEYANAGADAQLSGFDAAAILAGGGTAYAFLGMSAPGMAITNSFSPAALGNAAQNVRIGSEINGIDRGYLMDAQGLNLIKAPLTSAGSAMVAAATPTALGGEPWSIAAVIAGSLLTALGNSIQVNPITGERKSQLTQAGQLQTAVSIATAAIGGAYAKSATNVLGVQVTAAQGANAASSFITGGVRTDSSGNVIGYGFGGKEGRARLLRATAGAATSIANGNLPGTQGLSGFAQAAASTALNRASAVATEYLIQQTLGAEFSGFQSMQRPGLEGFSSLLAGAVSSKVSEAISEQQRIYVAGLIESGVPVNEALSILYGGAVAARRREDEITMFDNSGEEDPGASNERNISTDTGARLAQAILRNNNLLDGTTREERRAAYDKLYVELNKLSSNGMVSRAAVEAIARQVAGDYGGGDISIDMGAAVTTANRVYAFEQRESAQGVSLLDRARQAGEDDAVGNLKTEIRQELHRRASLIGSSTGNIGDNPEFYKIDIQPNDPAWVREIKTRMKNQYMSPDSVKARVNTYMENSQHGYNVSELKKDAVTTLYVPGRNGAPAVPMKGVVRERYADHLVFEASDGQRYRMSIEGGIVGGYNALGQSTSVERPLTQKGLSQRDVRIHMESAAAQMRVQRLLANRNDLGGTSYSGTIGGINEDVYSSAQNAVNSELALRLGDVLGTAGRTWAFTTEFLSNFDFGLASGRMSNALSSSAAINPDWDRAMLQSYQFNQARRRYSGAAGIAAFGVDLVTSIPMGGVTAALKWGAKAAGGLKAATGVFGVLRKSNASANTLRTLYGSLRGGGLSRAEALGRVIKFSGTGRFSMPGSARQIMQGVRDGVPFRAAGKDGYTVPYGFSSFDEYQKFTQDIQSDLQKAGYDDAYPMFQGSAVTGKSYKTGEWFDLGRTSDYDVAIVSERLFDRAHEFGARSKTDPMRIGPLDDELLDALGLPGLSTRYNKRAGRDVNFMIYPDQGNARRRASLDSPLW